MPWPRPARGALQRLWDSSEADYREQILELVPRGALRLLDVGCDDGEWTLRLASAVGTTHCSGIEIVDDARTAAQTRGVDARAGDLEGQWPFDADSFDLVHANQVIEHVKRLDHFVEEVTRVLRPGGTALICTENVASWHNVAAAAAGFVPFSSTNVSKLGPVGNPFAFHQGEQPDKSESWQHIHVLTMVGLTSIFELHGYRVQRRFGAGYYPAFGRVGRWMARHDVRHAHFIGLLAAAPN